MTKDLIAKASTTIDAPPSEVWSALVTPAAIKQYMFGADARSDWREGSAITWSGEWKGKPFQDKGVIRKIKPDHVLQYSHFSPLSGLADKPENYHTVTIELSNGDAKTRVMLTQDNNATDDARADSEKNWNTMLKGLKEFVESRAK
jgi:uncharacterized protein YndB with AHSA1/START domain